MCYPLPGPRCSSHTRASLISARAAWREAGTPEAKERYLTARDEYDTSPEGIARNRSLLEHHIKNGLSTRYVKARLAIGEQTRTEGIEAMAEQGITVKEEEAVSPYDEAGRDAEGYDAAGQDTQGTTVEAAEEHLRRQVLSESDYKFLKEMGPSYWSPADRKALQDYSAAQAALNVARAGDNSVASSETVGDEREVAVRAQQVEDAKQRLNAMKASEIRSLVGFNDIGKDIEDEDYQVEERGGKVYITGLVEYARGDEGGSFAVDKELDLDAFAPVRVGGSYDAMTNKQRLRAAEIMFGTDSDKYRDAVQKLA